MYARQDASLAAAVCGSGCWQILNRSSALLNAVAPTGVANIRPTPITTYAYFMIVPLFDFPESLLQAVRACPETAVVALRPWGRWIAGAVLPDAQGGRRRSRRPLVAGSCLSPFLSHLRGLDQLRQCIHFPLVAFVPAAKTAPFPTPNFFPPSH